MVPGSFVVFLTGCLVRLGLGDPFGGRYEVLVLSVGLDRGLVRFRVSWPFLPMGTSDGDNGVVGGL